MTLGPLCCSHSLKSLALSILRRSAFPPDHPHHAPLESAFPASLGRMPLLRSALWGLLKKRDTLVTFDLPGTEHICEPVERERER